MLPMDQQLYYQPGPVLEFGAEVTACRQTEKGWQTVLSRTAFYPEGGGQPGDRGVLLCGDREIPVEDVREKDGEIIHLTAEALKEGAAVRGKVDAGRRRDLTQQHSGEHILSGLICRAFSCDNVGFHISDDYVTIDYNVPISREQLIPLEQEANRLIRADLPVNICFPAPEELETLQYRSKKALTGSVRIVEFPGADICACCGTHVARTGEIGLIKVIRADAHRGGVRILMASGKRAYDYAAAVAEENRKISVLLAAEPLETASAAEHLKEECRRKQEKLAALEQRFIAAKCSPLVGAGNVLLVEKGLDTEEARRLQSAVMDVCGGLAGVVSETERGCSYVIGNPGGGLRAAAKALNAALAGRGGGSDSFVQGFLQAGADAAAEELRKLLPEVRTVKG